MLRHQIFLTALALLAITSAAVPLKNEVNNLGDRFLDINFAKSGATMPDKAPTNFVTVPPGPGNLAQTKWRARATS